MLLERLSLEKSSSRQSTSARISAESCFTTSLSYSLYTFSLHLSSIHVPHESLNLRILGKRIQPNVTALKIIRVRLYVLLKTKSFVRCAFQNFV